MRFARRVLLVFFLVLMLGSVGGVPAAHGQSADELQARIDESNKQIAKIRDEIAALQKELNSTTAEKQTLQNAINELNLSIQKIQKNISLTQAQINKKDLEIGDLSLSIADTSAKIARSQEGIGSTLRELHALDDEPVVLALLADGTLSSVFDEVAALGTLRDTLGTQVRDLSSLKGDLEGDKQSAEDKKQELTTLSKQLGEQRQGLDVAKGSQTQLLKETQNKEATYQAQIAQKQAEQAKFENELYQLSTQLHYTLNPNALPQAGKAALSWPLDNVTITQQFGRTVDAVRLYTSGTHDGIDLRAEIGTPVKAALGGTVYEINEGSAPLCQYGKWVLIKHPNGLATLYAHLSNIAVKKGATVATGQVIGYSGNTGYALGPHLHFTVYAADAVSLKQYTCKSGAVVIIPIAASNAYLNPVSYLP